MHPSRLRLFHIVFSEYSSTNFIIGLQLLHRKSADNSPTTYTPYIHLPEIMRKKFGGLILPILLVSFVLLGVHQPQSPSTSLAYAAKIEEKVVPHATDETHDHLVSTYQPIKKKGGFGRVLDWGLAKLENVYDGVLVSDLISAFIAKCDHIVTIMIHSFKELTMPYEKLHEKEVERLGQFDQEFKDLVKLRNKIDRKCLYSTNVEDRSMCIDKGVELHEKIQTLRSQRVKSAHSIERYMDMIEWCASYNNWFC